MDAPRRRARAGAARAPPSAPSPRAGTRLAGVGIDGDILYGPGQVRRLVEPPAAAGVRAAYRELDSTKGHDAFLVEWPQLSEILEAALAD